MLEKRKLKKLEIEFNLLKNENIKLKLAIKKFIWLMSQKPGSGNITYDEFNNLKKEYITNLKQLI